ncbi:MAG TPA: hypothetical protein ENJ12_07595, partial [Thiolapillus brandeum]|nr:hypothetical protein [Thiolapillus brandeum]
MSSIEGGEYGRHAQASAGRGDEGRGPGHSGGGGARGHSPPGSGRGAAGGAALRGAHSRDTRFLHGQGPAAGGAEHRRDAPASRGAQPRPAGHGGRVPRGRHPGGLAHGHGPGRMNRRVADQAYLDTRVSLLVGQLLHRPQRSRLLEQPYADLAPLLHKAGLASLAHELPASPGELEQVLASRLIDEAVLLMRVMNAAQRRFIRHWMRRLELINLKFLLRTRFARKQQPPDLLDLGPLASLPLQTLLATDSVEEFLRQLATTEYGQLAGPARKAYEEQRALFDVEATLDARYYSQLAHLAAGLEGAHREQVDSLLRVWLDQVNLVSL